MTKKSITIVQLYPRDMNIYGDLGNVLVLKKRLEWHGYGARVIEYNKGDVFPSDVDIIVGGGGQDSGQETIQSDLLSQSPRLHMLADSGVPMLVICGLYQLFGTSFKTVDDKTIQGIGIFDAKTYGTSERLIGNIVTHSVEFGEIIGYENHSGQTYLGKKVHPLGEVRVGAGNNLSDIGEGARYKNVIGSYLHGSLLPKNPAISDYLIRVAVERKYGTFKPREIDDGYATHARRIALKRPR